MATDKSRTYAYVQKLENLPADWAARFEDVKMPSCYIVHDKDEASPHVHFFVDFNSPVRSNTALSVIPDGFGIEYAEPVRNRNAYQRYMLHLDHPDKHQYPFDELIVLYGCKVNDTEVFSVDFEDVYDLIEKENITNFAELITVCMERFPMYIRYIATHTPLVKSYVMERARLVF